MNVETMLHDEIVSEMESLRKMEVGTDKYETAINGVTKLMDKAIEMERLGAENREKLDSREFENDLKMKQLKDERIDKIVKNSLTAISIVGGFGLTIWGTFKSIEFEKEGTITTFAGRNFINKLFFKK